jgi:hypothetical protein
MYVRAILHLAATKTKFHHTSIPHDKANMSIMPISYHRHELHDGKLLHYLHLSAKFDDSGRILIEYWLGEVWPSKRVVSASNCRAEASSVSNLCCQFLHKNGLHDVVYRICDRGVSIRWRENDMCIAVHQGRLAFDAAINRCGL